MIWRKRFSGPCSPSCSREAPMSELSRRTVLGTGAAAIALVGTNPTAQALPVQPVGFSNGFTSPRIERLRALAAHVVEVESRPEVTDAQIDAKDEAVRACIDDLAQLSDEIWEHPAPGILGVV